MIVRNQKTIPEEDTSLAVTSGAEIVQAGAFEAIKELVSFCEGCVWIVSKAGPRMQSRTLAWIEAVDFFSRTKLKPDHIRFCLEREEKKRICLDLEISHFIDDRVHVMQILRHTVPHLYLFGEEGGERFCPPWATFVTQWAQIPELVKQSLKKDR